MKQNYVLIIIFSLLLGGCGFFNEKNTPEENPNLKKDISVILSTANIDSLLPHLEENSLQKLFASGLLASEKESGKATAKFSELCFSHHLDTGNEFNKVLGYFLKAKSEKLQNQPEQAERSLIQAKEWATRFHFDAIIPYINAEKAYIHLIKNNPLAAIQLFKSLQKVNPKVEKSVSLKWMIQFGIVSAQIQLSHFNEAKGEYNFLLQTAKLTNNVDKIARTKWILAKISMGLNQWSSVSNQIHEAQLLAEISHNNVLKSVCLETLIELEQQRKNWFLVAENQEKLLILQKQMLISDPIDEIALDYLSNLKLNLSEKEKTDFKQTTERNKYLIVIIALVLILVSTFLIFSYRLSRKMKLANLKLLAKNREIHRKNGEIEKKSEELNRLNRVLEAKIQERTQKLIHQNSKLREVAYYNSHRVRGPLSTIMGLVELYQGKMLDDIQLLMREIDNHSKELDRNLFEINEVLRKEYPTNN